MIEREIGDRFADIPSLVLELNNPDFRTTVRVADAINTYSNNRYGVRVARERDYRSVVLRKPKRLGMTRFIAEIEELLVQPDQPARVVIDERTGTVVIGRNVQVSTVAVTHGNLTVRVVETPQISQPAPFSRGGNTQVVPRTFIDTNGEGGRMAIVGGSTFRRSCAVSTGSG